MRRLLAPLFLSGAVLSACTPQNTSSREHEVRAQAPAAEVSVAEPAQPLPIKTSVPTPVETKTSAPVSQGGLVVVVDPVTRQIREATPAEIGAMTAARPAAAVAGAPPAPAAPVFLQGPGGAVGMELGPESQVYTVATRAPDGRLILEEVTGEEAARKRVLSNGSSKSAYEK